MEKNILYIGGFNFDKTNASSIRVLENAKFFKKLNFNIEILGKISLINEEFKFIEGTKVSNVVENQAHFASDISVVMSRTIVLQTSHIIAYNYPPIAFNKLIKYCKEKNIVLIPDLTEWYGIDGAFTINKGIRFVLHQWRMYILNKKCNHKIVASSYLENVYRNSNNLLLPFVTTEVSQFENRHELQVDNLKFVYAGSPGKKFSKDRLDIILKAFSKIKQTYSNFSLHVVGLTKKQLLKIEDVKKEVLTLEENLKCYGRLKNEVCVEIIKKSDIVVFSRDVKRVTSAGFPTKVFEAFKYGLPVLTNKTSDIDHFVNDQNGFLVEKANINQFSKAISSILSSDAEGLQKIVQNCRNNNPFFYDKYKEPAELFFKKMNL